MITEERTSWMKSLKPGDTVVTIDAMSPTRVRIREHKISPKSDAEWLRFTGYLSGMGFKRTASHWTYDFLPNTPEAIAEETAILLRRYRVDMAARRLTRATDSQLEQIEAILAKKGRRTKCPHD